jgi:GNAT superfamily N-acetyltransferase
VASDEADVDMTTWRSKVTFEKSRDISAYLDSGGSSWPGTSSSIRYGFTSHPRPARSAGPVPPFVTFEGPAVLAALRRIAVRHRLTPSLREVGGHIGYDVRPSARRRGHATAMLRAALPVAHALGIERALVTCDVDNVGSGKVIESNGGVPDGQRGETLHFWYRPDRRQVDHHDALGSLWSWALKCSGGSWYQL